MAHQHGDTAEDDPTRFWEHRYRSSERVWSGRPNPVLRDVAASLRPGRALDLGCGEGADVIWLAQHGWDATGIDISPTATSRAARAAASSGIPGDRVRFVAADLSSWPGEGPYDLVAASFLQSPVELPRTEVLRRAAGLVRDGGHLLVVSHAAFPPWAGSTHGRDYRFLTPREEIDDLALDPDLWSTVIAEIRSRPAAGPDGEHATLEDSVVLLRRG